MNQTQKNNLPEPDDKLQQVVSAIRQEAIPEIPELPQADIVVSKDDRFDGRPRSKSAAWLSRSSWRVAGALAASIVFGCLMFLPQSTPSVFAKMKAALAQVNSISYTVVDRHENTDTTYVTKVAILEPDLSRSETAAETSITNWNLKLRLTAKHDEKTAVIEELDPSDEFSARRARFLALLREVPEHATEYLGPKKWQDQSVEVFRLPIGDRKFEVFVDPDSGLPLLMTFDGAVENKPWFRETLQDFRFDVELAADQFKVDPPTGYEVIRVDLEVANPLGESLKVSPKYGIDQLNWGASKKEVIALLGEPSEVRVHDLSQIDGIGEGEFADEFIWTMEFNNLGLTLSVHSDRGMEGVHCLQRSPSQRGFAGETAEGIRLGDPLKKVFDVYGKPDIHHESEAVHYLREGWMFYITEGHVSRITVSQPLADNVRIEVHDDGSWSQTWEPDDDGEE